MVEVSAILVFLCGFVLGIMLGVLTIIILAFKYKGDKNGTG